MSPSRGSIEENEEEQGEARVLGPAPSLMPRKANRDLTESHHASREKEFRGRTCGEISPSELLALPQGHPVGLPRPLLQRRG